MNDGRPKRNCLGAVILAAGQGTRLNASIPKAFIEIGEKTILQRQVEQLRSWGVEDVTIVVGSGGVWSEENQTKAAAFAKVIVNEDSLETQSTYSLELAVNAAKPGCSYLIIDGDLVLGKEVLNALTMLEEETAVIVKQGYGSSLELERRGKDGYWLNRVGEYRDSDTIYAGIMRIDGMHLEVFEKHLPAFKADIMGMLLSEVCRDIPIRAIRMLEGDKGEGPLEVADMRGGSFARTNKVVTENGLVLRKEIFTPGKKKLEEEVAWLIGLEEDLKPHFPEVLAHHINPEPDFVEMRFYSMPTLRQLLMKGEMGLDEALGFLKEVMAFLFDRMYESNKTQVPADFVRDNYLYKTIVRLSEAGQMSEKINRLNQAQHLVINGKKYVNILPLLRHLNHHGEAFLSKVTPPHLNLIHGDLHFDNILYGEPFIMVDPRGWKYGDTAYDMGKLRHSCHGLYDFLHEGLFDLERAGSSFTLEFPENPVRKIYEAIDDWLLSQFDEDLRLRTEFSEAMHFSSVVPFHISNEKLAIACYLTGVIQFNSVYSVEERAMDIQGRIINVNKLDDYKEALAIIEDSIDWS